MYVTDKDMSILRKANVIELGKKYKALTGKGKPAFNYENFPYGAQTYVEYLEKLIEKAVSNQRNEKE